MHGRDQVTRPISVAGDELGIVERSSENHRSEAVTSVRLTLSQTIAPAQLNLGVPYYDCIWRKREGTRAI